MRGNKEEMATQVRLLKVFVQPVVVVIDDSGAREEMLPVVSVPAVEWPTFSASTLGEGEMQLIEEKLLAPHDDAG